MYEDDSSFQHSSKTKLVCGQGENLQISPETINWDHYQLPYPYDDSFNALPMNGSYCLAPFASPNDPDQSFTQQSNLLKVMHSESQNSNSESTEDKTPQMDDTSVSFLKSRGSKIPRRLQQPNRFEKSLDQTLILENEFKK